MGLKGKLIASVEVKCEGDSMHDIVHSNPHHVSNISRIVDHFEIHEGENIKIGSIVSWHYNEAGQNKFMKEIVEAIDPEKKTIRWKIIEGNVLDMYSSFTLVTSFEPQWATWTIEYEKKTEDTPEPLVELGLIIEVTKDMENHLFKN